MCDGIVRFIEDFRRASATAPKAAFQHFALFSPIGGSASRTLPSPFTSGMAISIETCPWLRVASGLGASVVPGCTIAPARHIYWLLITSKRYC